VGRRGREPPKSVRIDARRLALGRSVPSHPELIYHLVGKEFGVPPWIVEEAEAGDVMRAFMLMNDLAPKEK
jgi:hypothetical protein